MKLELNKWYWDKEKSCIQCYTGKNGNLLQAYGIRLRDGYFFNGNAGYDLNDWIPAKMEDIKKIIFDILNKNYKVGTKFRSLENEGIFYEILSMDGEFLMKDGHLEFNVKCRPTFLENDTEVGYDLDVPIYYKNRTVEIRKSKYNKIDVIAYLDACDFDGDVEEWCIDNEVGTHYEGGQFSIDWEDDEENDNTMTKYLLTTYGPDIKKYNRFAVNPT